MIRKRAREGELMIDHRASPGLPAGFYRSIGLEGLDCPEGSLAEAATITCAHCNTVVIMNPDRSRARGHCHKCDAYVCDNPACHRDCTPFSKILDVTEAHAYRAGQNLLLQTKGF